MSSVFATLGEYPDAREVEAQLLEQLQGKRLIAELRLSANEHQELRTCAAEVVRAMGGGRRAWRRCPALLATYLVAEGIFSYDGSFWPHTIEGLDAQTAGPAFEETLSLLGLETFAYLVRDDNALRFLGPILAHGGIPRYCLGDFFTLLTSELRNGSADAADLLAIWRTRRTRFQGIDQPVRRFLLFGGDLARDLVGRCIDMVEETSASGSVPDGSTVGLPGYILDEYARFRRRSGTVVGPRRTLPRPRVVIDPWDTLGPVLVLPPVDLSDATWRVSRGEGAAASVDAIRQGEVTLQLRPARSWEVELFDNGERRRSYGFECFDDIEAAFFDPANGQLARDPRQLSLEAVWALAPAGVQFMRPKDGEELRCIEQLPTPTSDWHGYTLACLDLKGVTAFEIRGTSSLTFVRVKQPTERPRLVGAVVEGVVTSDGAPVYSRPPSIALPEVAHGLGTWRIRLRSRDHEVFSGSAADLVDPDGSSVDLEPLMRGRCVGIFSLSVQGPLGSDLPQTTFALVEGLGIHRPRRLLLPEETASVKVRADPTIELEGGGSSASLAIAAGTDSVECRAASQRRAVALQIRVPRLAWGIVRRDGIATMPGGSALRLDADELRDGTVAALAVRTGSEGTRLLLRLRGGPGGLEQSEEAITRGEDGRWTFDLGRFADTIRASQEATVRLELIADGRSVTVATVDARLEVRNIQAVSRVIGDFASVHLAFDENRPLRGRVARLWPRDRPWAPAIEEPIADGVRGEAELSGYSRILPGRYRAEIAVADGWTTPRRPRQGAPNTADIRVGEVDDFNAYLDGLDPADPWTALELAAARGEWPREGVAFAWSEIAEPALRAAFVFLRDVDPGDPLPNRFRATRKIALADPFAFASAVTRLGTDPAFEPGDLVRFGVCTAHGLREIARGVGRSSAWPDSTMRGVWQGARLVGALLDLDRADDEALARCEQFLGWTRGAAPLAGGLKVDQKMAGKSRGDLCEIRRMMELVPKTLLGGDALLSAYFEWLIAQKEAEEQGGGESPFALSPASWWKRQQRLVDLLPWSDMPVEVHDQLGAREPPPGTFPWAALPVVSLAAAVHVMLRTPEQAVARRALDEALTFAPALVEHDLVLAAILVPLAEEDAC